MAGRWWASRSCLRAVALFAAVVPGGCAAPVDGLYPPAATEECRTIRLVQRSWHTGLLVPADAVDHPVTAHFPDARHLEFGWGDRAFYMADAGGAGLALRAALLPTDSVMHVAGFAEPLCPGARATRDVIEIGVSRRGLARMVRAITADFALDPAGAPVPLGPGRYGDGRFFASDRTYHLLHNSNAWTAAMLAEAGFPVVPSLVPSADNLMAHVRARAPAPCRADGD